MKIVFARYRYVLDIVGQLDEKNGKIIDVFKYEDFLFPTERGLSMQPMISPFRGNIHGFNIDESRKIFNVDISECTEIKTTDEMKLVADNDLIDMLEKQYMRMSGTQNIIKL